MSDLAALERHALDELQACGDEAALRAWNSRYFGPLPVSTIVGRAIPVWTTDDTDPAAESLREPVSDEP